MWPLAPARATIITEALEGIVVGGPFAGTVGTGSFTYDDSLIFGSGSEFIGPLDGLAVDIRERFGVHRPARRFGC